MGGNSQIDGRTLRELYLLPFEIAVVETAGFASLSAKEFRKLTVNAGLDCPSAHRVRVPEFNKLLDDAKAMRIPNSNTAGRRRSGSSLAYSLQYLKATLCFAGLVALEQTTKAYGHGWREE